MEMEIETSVGKFVLTDPLAGERNDAIELSEYADGIHWTKFLNELLPFCIVNNPFNLPKNKLKERLRKLSRKDYDILVKAMNELINGVDNSKKLEEPSELVTTEVVSQ